MIDLNSIFLSLESSQDSSQEEKPVCNTCGEEISSNNCATKEGWAEYNISGMCEKCFDNMTFSLEDGLDNVPEVILNMIKDGIALGGGALRSFVDEKEPICDYDIFFTDAKKIDPTKKYLISQGFNKIFECPLGQLTTFVKKCSNGGDVLKVQLINKRPYSSVEDIISSFDITACCAAYDGEQFYTHERFVFDVLNKRININRVEFPLATMRRIIKYVQKGYTLTNKGNEDFINAVNMMVLTEDNKAFYID